MTQVVDPYSHIRFEGAVHPGWVRPSKALPRRALAACTLQPRGEAHPPVISPADRLLVEEIFRRTQMNVGAYRPTALGRRIPACLRALQARTHGEALRMLEKSPAALDLALNALLIGVTAFFRDPAVFAHLRKTALPGLLRSVPDPRLLSVGCSDGAELYSLAICLKELGCEKFSLRGMDCRPRAIERARTGWFPAGFVEHLPPEIVGRHFDRQGRGYRVKAAIRELAQWQVADAFIHSFLPRCDLIACRNVAIYLEHPAAARLWRKVEGALNVGGLLLTGNAEHPASGFLRCGPCLFRKASP